MADFISFNDGRKELANNGMPAVCVMALSTKDCNTHVVTDVITSFGEITGTGYARQTQSEPTASSANPSVISFAQATWATGTNTDWPASVKSCVFVTSTDSSGKMICAWNLVAGGTARAMNLANTTENFTGTLNVA